MNQKRFTIPLDDNLHLEIKVKAAVLGLPMTEIMRRLLIAWLRDEVTLPIYPGDVFDGGRIVESGSNYGVRNEDD